MSKRGPIITVGAIAAVVLVTPFAIGMVAENGMREQIALAEGRPPLTRTITRFDRGWFSSVAEIEVGIDPGFVASLTGGDPAADAAELAAFRLPVIVEIAHGPVLLDDGFALGTASVKAYANPEAELAVIAEQWLGMPYLFAFHGRAGFGTGFKYAGEIPPGEFQMPDVGISMTGFQFTGLIRGTRRVLDGELGNLSLTSPFATALVEGFTLYSDTDRARTDLLPLGAVTMELGNLRIEDPLQGPEPIVALEGASVVVSIEADASGDFLGFGVDYGADRLDMAGFAGTALELGLRVDHVDAAAVYELLAAAGAVGATVADEALLELVEPLLDRIVTGAPELAIDPFSVTMAEGRLMGRASVAIDPAALPNGSYYDLWDPAVIRTALNANIDLVADKPLAARLAGIAIRQFGPDTGLDSESMLPEQQQAMAALQGQLILAALAAQGIFVDEDDAWSVEITLADGVPMANGRPLTLGL